MSAETDALARAITKHSSRQTYYTIKLLVDKPLVADCYKAYAYFRWADDQVDEPEISKKTYTDFVTRQTKIITAAYKHEPLPPLLPQEKMVVELIKADTQTNSKLKSFITNFWAIIQFDAQRKGTVVSQKQLHWYSQTLGKAVTDGILYFIGNKTEYPRAKNQYDAAIAAHLIHMLRDYREDVTAGYVNIPQEYLIKNQITATDWQHPLFKAWVKNQLVFARTLMESGKHYIESLPGFKCQLAAMWYCARFERLLPQIEGDHYILRDYYRRGGILTYSLRFGWLTVRLLLQKVSRV